MVRKASTPLEHIAARLWGHHVVYHPQSWGEHAHVTAFCKMESTFQIYKTSAWDLAVGLFETWSIRSCANSLKRGFTSPKSCRGGGATLATVVANLEFHILARNLSVFLKQKNEEWHGLGHPRH